MGYGYRDPNKLKIDEPFETLFPIDNATLNAVIVSMEQDGFDPAQPIAIWKERDCVLDGHTRMSAAIAAGIDRVPVVEKSFAYEDAAVEYAIHCQRDRRNLTPADLLRWIAAADKLKQQGERTDLAQGCAKSGKSAEETAAVVGVSARTVEKARAVLADPDASAAVESGGKSINAAYNETRAKRSNSGERKQPTADAAPNESPAHILEFFDATIEMVTSLSVPATSKAKIIDKIDVLVTSLNRYRDTLKVIHE